MEAGITEQQGVCYKEAHAFRRREYHFKDQLPQGFYSVPSELGAPRFNTDVLPSIIRDHDGVVRRQN